MTPNRLSKRVVIDRLSWVERMIGYIRALPLDDREAFFADRRNVGAAESYLRRALEALPPEEAQLLRVLAGYRNRLVHFYHEVGPGELYEICAHRLADVEHIAEAYRTWLREHEEWLNETL